MRSTFVDWWRGLPIPFLVAGPNGQAEALGWPQYIDDTIVDADDARKVAYPDEAPSDALAHLGNDRNLIRGQAESEVSYRIRLRDAWAQWSRAGTPLAVLEQLEFYGMRGAVWVQQNGLEFTLSAAPTAGVDPTPLLVVTPSQALAAPLTSTVPPYRTIPAGTPWHAFDGNTDLTNRFAILMPTWTFSSITTANFASSDTATVTWPIVFADTSYHVLVGVPSDSVIITVDGASKTTTGITLQSTASWSGSVAVIAYATGVDPFNVFTVASPGAIKRIIITFRPNALCMGVSSIASGSTWGYPAALKWGDGHLWGGSVSQLLGVF